MNSAIQNQYLPETVTPPGDSLRETLDALGMTQRELAERTGKTKKTINEIIKGKAPITPETALQLERVFGIPAGFWNNRERHYREALARREERGRLQDQVSWLHKFPINDMIRLGWIRRVGDKVEQFQEVLSFFGVGSPREWAQLWEHSEVAVYRKSRAFQADLGAVSAWLRQGELVSQDIDCQPFDSVEFKKVLHTVRGLTAEAPNVFQPQLVALTAVVGVAVAFVPELPRTRLSGATRWLSKDKALIQLSLRYRSNDQLWFTFFHEAGHILLHRKREVFLEDGGASGSPQEIEADEFASDFLVPRQDFKDLIGTRRFSKRLVCDFASRIGVSPGIVVGRLHHEGLLPYTHLNGLKMRLDWAE